MASHLLWFRLPKGRVWHVAASGALVALCGQSIPARGERQPKRPPFGARPCPDCDNVAIEAATALGMAITNHQPPTVAPFQQHFNGESPVLQALRGMVVGGRRSGKTALSYVEWNADPDAEAAEPFSFAGASVTAGTLAARSVTDPDDDGDELPDVVADEDRVRLAGAEQ